VHAEVFEDFLDMAADLLQHGYAPSAAVLAGSVLEEHVRKLAAANGLDVRDVKGKAIAFNTLAVDLTKRGTILETERKSLVAWYGLRTAGAHGRHAEVVKDDVAHAIPGVREFMVRHPA
jgi:hypothetical protein